MWFPAIQGVIDRRLLVNFRADPDATAKLLPAPFEPIVVRGHAIVGLCLIRLRGVRPAFLPCSCGIRSENVAHRIAVRWRDGAAEREGVYIVRRDSSSRLNAIAGGRVFPGVHRRAKFSVTEASDAYAIDVTTRDGGGDLSFRGRRTEEWPAGSVFETVQEASAFFARGSLGYSPTKRKDVHEGLELRCRSWNVEPVTMESVRTAFFESESVLPGGNAVFDCALVMRNIQHEWHGREQMCCPQATIGVAA